MTGTSRANRSAPRRYGKTPATCPKSQSGISATDTFILTPTVDRLASFPIRQDVNWAAGGGAVILGYVFDCQPPSRVIENPRVRAYQPLVSVTDVWVSGVEQRYQRVQTLSGCDAGANGVPAASTVAVGGVASITVVNGVVSLTPVAQNGILATDALVLTPTAASNGLLTWTVSGGAVTAGYVFDYQPPTRIIENPRAKR